jgi:hypothetical protein
VAALALGVLRTPGAMTEGIGGDSAVLVTQVAGDLCDQSDYPDQHDEDERYEDDTNEDGSHHYSAQ